MRKEIWTYMPDPTSDSVTDYRRGRGLADDIGTPYHILQSRSAKKGLESHILLLDIKNVLCKIREKYSKYKPIIDAILAGEYDPG